MVELMVGLLLGSLLVLGLVQVFAASRTTYQLSEGAARVQESARFAMHYLQHDIRMAGHFGCVSDQTLSLQGGGVDLRNIRGAGFAVVPPSMRFDVSLQGYEATGTGPGATGVALPVTPSTGGNFSPALPAELSTATSNRVANSDILVLRFLAAEGVSASSAAWTPAANMVMQWDSAGSEGLLGGHGTLRLLGVSDCNAAFVAPATAFNAASGQATLASAGFSRLSPTQTTLYRAESLVYYVGLSAASQRPALYRVRFPGMGQAPVRDELVEGVESMQLLYGQDRNTNLAQRPSGHFDRIHAASTVSSAGVDSQQFAEEWRRVGAVQIGLVLASTDPATAQQQSAALMAAGVRFTAPQDGRYRAVHQSTVALRNRLPGN